MHKRPNLRLMLWASCPFYDSFYKLCFLRLKENTSCFHSRQPHKVQNGLRSFLKPTALSFFEALLACSPILLQLFRAAEKAKCWGELCWGR